MCTHTHTQGTSGGVSPGEHRVLLWLGGLLPWFDDFLHAPYKAWTLYSSFTKLFSGPGWVGITEARGRTGKEVTGNLSFLPGAVCSAVSLLLRVGRR